MVRTASKWRLRCDLQSLSGRLLFLFWLLIIISSAAVNVYLAKYHAESVALEQARTMFEHIVLTRNWNALHGGVYVPISETNQPNPHLKGDDRDLVTEDGTRLTKINPAYMTRQVAELAQQESGVQFHITSLNLIRPQNAPTPWERAALERFELGEKESGQFLYAEHKYRYMAPLITTKACLTCHDEQGYKLGDIRGGISVTQPVEGILHNREHAIVNSVIVHLLVLIISGLALRSYARSQQRLQQLRIDKEGAEQANAFKGAFIARISHELRTPLNAILGMSYTLDGEALTATQRGYLQKISAAGKQLNTMINHILDFSQLDAGTMELTIAPLQLRQLVQDSVEVMRGRASKKGLTLEVAFGEGFPEWLQGDGQHIQQILFHLIDNAIKYTESGGIEVAASAQRINGGRYGVTLSVQDSGMGIERSAEWLQQHDFTQIEDYHDRHQGGVGLGLTLSRRLLQLMGGTMHIQSEPGRGTLVTLEFVMEAAQAPPASDKGAAAGERAVSQSAQKSGADTEQGGAVRELDVAQRQRLQQQLSQLLVSLESDLTLALQSATSLLEEYQGTDCQQQLEKLSEKLVAFDSDGVVMLVAEIQQKLLHQQ